MGASRTQCGQPTDLDAPVVQRPPRTSLWFSVAQVLSEPWREGDDPLSEHLVADVETALVKQRLKCDAG